MAGMSTTESISNQVHQDLKSSANLVGVVYSYLLILFYVSFLYVLENLVEHVNIF